MPDPLEIKRSTAGREGAYVTMRHRPAEARGRKRLFEVVLVDREGWPQHSIFREAKQEAEEAFAMLAARIDASPQG